MEHDLYTMIAGIHQKLDTLQETVDELTEILTEEQEETEDRNETAIKKKPTEDD